MNIQNCFLIAQINDQSILLKSTCNILQYYDVPINTFNDFKKTQVGIKLVQNNKHVFNMVQDDDNIANISYAPVETSAKAITQTEIKYYTGLFDEINEFLNYYDTNQITHVIDDDIKYNWTTNSSLQLYSLACNFNLKPAIHSLETHIHNLKSSQPIKNEEFLDNYIHGLYTDFQKLGYENIPLTYYSK